MSITKDSPPRTLLRGESLKLIIAAAIYFFIFRFAPAAFASSTVVINEFSSQTSPDWVEIYNNSDAAVDLSSYGLTDAANNPKSFNCILAPHGFSIVDWSNKLNNAGDTVFLKLGDETVDCISFGDGADDSCPEEFGPTLANPSADQVGSRIPDGGAWQLTAASTKDAPNDVSSKPAGAVCSTPTPTPSPTPTISPTSTPKPATATPAPTNTSTPASTPTSSGVKPSPQVLAAADEGSDEFQPEVNLDIIDMTATSEAEINASPSSQPQKSGGKNLPVVIISAAGIILMLGGGLPLIWSELKSRKK